MGEDEDMSDIMCKEQLEKIKEEQISNEVFQEDEDEEVYDELRILKKNKF
jgi:Mrp family chromosome partitioning ATPase